MPDFPSVSVVVPTFNRASMVQRCIRALLLQDYKGAYEIIVIDDGSQDNTENAIKKIAENTSKKIIYYKQSNGGPSKARNSGISIAENEIILFTDDDCEPLTNWMTEMVKPFLNNPDVIATKGAYLSKQINMTARFVQAEYENRYKRMRMFPDTDFIDTYSAAYRADILRSFGGFDTSLIAAEDADLSYRLSSLNKRMLFVESAKVYHSHPDSFFSYLKKKRGFAYWRFKATERYKDKRKSDSHTPQLMKFQLLLLPALIGSTLSTAFIDASLMHITAGSVLSLFILSTLPILNHIPKQKYDLLGFCAPFYLIGRSIYQFLGLTQAISEGFLTKNR